MAARLVTEQLAAFTGLSVRTIQRIEQGQRPGLESLKALAAVFEASKWRNLTVQATEARDESDTMDLG
jgi:transcriptional regulator with XRE-family HTH domain